MEEFMLALKLMYEIISYILVPVLIICFFILLNNVIELRKNSDKAINSDEYEKALFFKDKDEIIKLGKVKLWEKIMYVKNEYIEDKDLFIKEVDEIFKNLHYCNYDFPKSVQEWKSNLSNTINNNIPKGYYYIKKD